MSDPHRHEASARQPSGSAARTLRRRVVRVGLVAGGLALFFGGERPVGSTLPELAAGLGASAGVLVEPDDIRWEPSGGVFADLALGRPLLFLARVSPGAPRDLFRARVRLAAEGVALTVVTTHNLTQTPLGDDHALVMRGGRAAFATAVQGQEQSVTLLELAPPPPPSETPLGERLMRRLTNLQETGSAAGLARTDVTLDPPPPRLGLELGEAALRIDTPDGSRIRSTVVDVAAASGTELAGLRIERSERPPKKLVHWAVDTVRAVSWIGPAPIAWLEEKAFGLRDTLRRAAFNLRSDEGASAAAPQVAAPALLSAHLASADDGSWPPPPIPSPWKKPEPGEGEWVPAKPGFSKRLELAGAPAAFLRTFVRPDEQRPYAKVLLVAMDSRRVDLDMEAGSEDPKPLTGPAGPGRIPRDPRIATRVVAAFNGAFKTEHGYYGMMVKRRVLLPPQPNAATVVVLKDGRAAFGTWGKKPEITSLGSIAESDIVSLRQNLDPLVDGGRVNPQKRSLWGFTLPGTGMQTERSGLCVTGAGHMLYAWGDDVSGITLAKAMQMAGCTFGMHLDMNPHHTGFLFTNIDDMRAKKYRSELLTTEMSIPTDRYLEHAAKDFFYVLARDPSPEPLPHATWAPWTGAQPPPAWMPGLYEATFRAESGTLVSLYDVEPERAAFRLRRGTLDGAAPHEGARHDAGPPASPETTTLSADDQARVLFAVGLGRAHEKRPRGLSVGGTVITPVRGVAESALLVADGNRLTLRPAAEASTADAVELPLLFLGTERHAPAAASVPGTVRQALGTTPSGRVVVARAVDATDASLADALRAAGCDRAVLLDRGHAGRAFDRTGTPATPRSHYEETILYGIATPLRPRALRFDAQEVARAP